MGSGSDFTAFQDFAGVPSLDMGFSGSDSDAIYHYHSNYDSFYWMQNFGDPGFIYHKAMAQVMSLIAAQLVDLPVLSFRAEAYAKALGSYVSKVEDKLHTAMFPSENAGISSMSEEDIFKIRASHRRSSRIGDLDGSRDAASPDALSFKRSLRKLYKAVEKLKDAAVEIDKHARELEDRTKQQIPWWKWPAWLKLGLEIRKVNTKYKYLERSFLYDEGLDGRPWFKHVIFAPGLWTGYAGGKCSR